MALTVEKLCSNPNFILKILVLVSGISVIFLDWPVLCRLIGGLELGHLMAIAGLLITYIFFELTPFTEIFMLGAALFQLIPATVSCASLHEKYYSNRAHLHLSLNVFASVMMTLDIFLSAMAIYRLSATTRQRRDRDNVDDL